MLKAQTLIVYGLEGWNGAEPRVCGKVVAVDGVRVFYREFKKAELHKWSAFSIDARVLPLLKARKVVYIDEVQDGKLYRVHIDTFEKEAIEAEHSAYEGRQLYLEISRWALIPLFYKPDHRPGIDVVIPKLTRIAANWVPIEPGKAREKPAGKREQARQVVLDSRPQFGLFDEPTACKECGVMIPAGGTLCAVCGSKHSELVEWALLNGAKGVEVPSG